MKLKSIQMRLNFSEPWIFCSGVVKGLFRDIHYLTIGPVSIEIHTEFGQI